MTMYMKSILDETSLDVLLGGLLMSLECQFVIAMPPA